MAITYRTVIAKAIAHFNDIQTALHDLGAKYNDSVIEAATSSADLLPTDLLDSIILDQLQLKASGNIELQKQSGTDVSKYATASVVRGILNSKVTLSELTSDGGSSVTVNTRYFKITPNHEVSKNGWVDSTTNNGAGSAINYVVKAGSATTPTNSTAISSSSTSLSGTTLTVQASVTPTVSAGWVDAGTAGTVKISGTVPTEEKTVSAAGSITPTSGKLISKVTVGEGAITNTISGDSSFTPEIGKYTSDGSNAGVNITSSGTLTEGTEPTDGYYVALQTSAQSAKSLSVSSTVTKAGWISASNQITQDTASVGLNASKVAYLKLPTATAKVSATSGQTYGNIINDLQLVDGYLYIDAGYLPNTKISVSVGSLLPEISSDALANHILNGYSAYNEKGQLITGTYTRIAKTLSGGYYTTDSSAGLSESEIHLISENGTATPYYLKSGKAEGPSSVSGSDATVSVSGSTIKLTKSVSITPTVTAGYVSAGTAKSATVELTGTVATTTLSTATTKSCVITNNSTSPTKSGESAIVSDTVSGDYVVLKATSTGKASVGTGYINSSEIDFASSDEAKVAALVNKTYSTTASGSGTVGGAATYNSTTGSLATSYRTGDISVSGSTAQADAKDKYIVGGLTVSASGKATANVNTDATGETTDKFVEALYKRILGQNYTDPGSTEVDGTAIAI